MLLVRDRLRREWGYPGGYVDRNESPLVGCAREVYEEVGIIATPNRFKLLDVHQWHRPLGMLTFTTFSLHVTAKEAAQVKLQARELSAFEWVNRDDALVLLAPRLKDRFEELLGILDLPASRR